MLFVAFSLEMLMWHMDCHYKRRPKAEISGLSETESIAESRYYFGP